MADLPAIGDLGEFEEGRGAAVGVEHFGAVELAVAVDRGEAPVGVELVVDGEVDVVNLTVEAELVIAQRRCARRIAAEVGVAEGIGRPARRAGEGREAARDERRSAIALLVIGADEVDRQILGRAPAQRGAQAELVLCVEFFLLIGGKVLNIAIARAPFARQAEGQRVAADIDEAAQQGLVEVAIAAAHFSREAFTRAGRDDADRTHGAGGAEQGRLRALDHFDAFQIVDRLIAAARARDIDAVVIERDARALLGRAAIRGDAANHDAGVVGALLLNQQAGDVA